MFAYRVSHIDPSIVPLKVRLRIPAGILISDSERSAQLLWIFRQHFAHLSQYLRGFQSEDTLTCARARAFDMSLSDERSVLSAIFLLFLPFSIEVSTFYSPGQKSVDFEIGRPCCDQTSSDEILVW